MIAVPILAACGGMHAHGDAAGHDTSTATALAAAIERRGGAARGQRGQGFCSDRRPREHHWLAIVCVEKGVVSGGRNGGGERCGAWQGGCYGQERLLGAVGQGIYLMHVVVRLKGVRAGK